jgi:hypothetical protein
MPLQRTLASIPNTNEFGGNDACIESKEDSIKDMAFFNREDDADEREGIQLDMGQIMLDVKDLF